MTSRYLHKKNEKDLETLIYTRIYSQDIGIEFGIEKYAILVMKSGNRQIRERIELPKQERIRMRGEKKNHKCLEADTIKQVEMKEKIRKE